MNTAMTLASSRALRSAGFLEMPRSPVMTTQFRRPISGNQSTSAVFGANSFCKWRVSTPRILNIAASCGGSVIEENVKPRRGGFVRIRLPHRVHRA